MKSIITFAMSSPSTQRNAVNYFRSKFQIMQNIIINEQKIDFVVLDFSEAPARL